MNDGPVVCNTSPLIALSDIGYLDLLRAVYGRIIIPSEVRREALTVPVLPDWIDVRDPQRVPRGWNLDPGEMHAIALALELGARVIVLDDRSARAVAEQSGLSVIGTVGVILLARHSGVVPAVRPVLESLRTSGFRLSDASYRLAIAESGEAKG